MRTLLPVCAALLTLSAIGATASATPVQFFDNTPGLTTFVAPNTGIYNILALGAQGGASRYFTYIGFADQLGGLGAETGGDFSLTAGETLTIAVGGHGADGGNGAPVINYVAFPGGGGGGGGSFVVGPNSTPLVVAGGGGGAKFTAGGPGQAGTSGQGVLTFPPSIGGGPRGPGTVSGGGSDGSGGGSLGAGGGGGFYSSGADVTYVSNGSATVVVGGGASFPSLVGGIGESDNPYGLNGGNGGFGGGGGGDAGAGGEPGLGPSSVGGGGGGGGYSGGAGGSAGDGVFTQSGGSGGGGGGSFDAGLINADLLLVAGVNGGDGSVTITELSSTPVPEPTSIALLGSAFAGLLAWRSRRRLF